MLIKTCITPTSSIRNFPVIVEVPIPMGSEGEIIQGFGSGDFIKFWNKRLLSWCPSFVS